MKIIFVLFLSFFLFDFPFFRQVEFASIPAMEFSDQVDKDKEIKSAEINLPKPMTLEELEVLLGPDPYLGQTDWLSSKKN